MSPLTKLFVVLQTLFTLALAAGAVVFVNQTEDYRGKATLAQQQMDAQRAESQRQQNIANSIAESARNAAAQARSQADAARAAVNDAATKLADREKSLGDLNLRMAQVSADVTRLTEALKASEETKSRLQEQVASFRNLADERMKQNGELNLTVTELSNKLAVTERERTFLAEQLAQLRGQSDRLSAAIRDMGGNPNAIVSGAPGVGTRGGAPAINGVVRQVSTIGGVKYASISVGSNDNVVKGMEFKIVSRETGDFLGILIVDSVEATEATGRLAGGPRVDQVRPGVEVRTQL